MCSKASKAFVSSFKRKWIWVFVSVITLGIIYAIYIAYDTDSDTEYVDDGDQEQVNNNPTRAVTPLHDFFLIIQGTGADFNPNIVSDYRKFNLDSISPQKAAVNLGVFAADIGYLSTYGRIQQTLNYVDIYLELQKAVCGEDINKFDVLDRIEKNLSNPDSLIRILSLFNNSECRYMLENEHRDLGLLILFGAFIEAQYITTQVIKVYPADLLPGDMGWQVLSPLISIVLDQKEFLRNLIKELENLEGKEEWELACLNSLKELYRIYTKPPSIYYPPPQGPHSIKKIILLSEHMDQIRANLIY